MKKAEETPQPQEPAETFEMQSQGKFKKRIVSLKLKYKTQVY